MVSVNILTKQSRQVMKSLFSLFRYIYSGQYQLATVQFGLYSLIMCVFSLGLAVGVVIAVGMLFLFQARAIIRNRTGIEDWIVEKAKYRREESGEEFIFPYDVGKYRNIKQVINWSSTPFNDGITWDVLPNCDQYTLTVRCFRSKVKEHIICKGLFYFATRKNV